MDEEVLEKPVAKWPRRALQGLLEGIPAQGFGRLHALLAETLADLPPAERVRHLLRWGREVPCGDCGGGRLRKEWLSVRVGGFGIAELSRLPVGELRAKLSAMLSAIELSGRSLAISGPILDEIIARLSFLEDVGLGYLTLDRQAGTLSTGEAQRIRLGAQLGSNLRGVCYILDEPTIGLHPRDGARLLDMLRRLRDRGNSVLVVEHDEDTIRAADHVIDMGLGRAATAARWWRRGPSPRCRERAIGDGAYFRKLGGLPVGSRPPEPAVDLTRAIEVHGASLHNLKGVSARFPLGAVTVVTGVSGAGKSTLVRGVLEESVRRRLRGLRSLAGCRGLEGADLVEAVREVDQLPIGRTPRSTPATYVGLWSRIRAIFASSPEAKARGYDARRFPSTPRAAAATLRRTGRIAWR